MKRLTSATLLSIVVGCSADAGTGPESPAFHLYAASDGCTAVRFIVHESGTFPTFPGIVTGDLEGAVMTEFTSLIEGPAVNVGRGVTKWQITGGVIPGLVGREFETAIEALTIFVPNPKDPLVFAVRANDHAIAGIRSADLTAHGLLDASDPPLEPPFDVELRYQGTLCP